MIFQESKNCLLILITRFQHEEMFVRQSFLPNMHISLYMEHEGKTKRNIVCLSYVFQQEWKLYVYVKYCIC